MFYEKPNIKDALLEVFYNESEHELDTLS